MIFNRKHNKARQAELDRLNVMLKMFDINMFTHYNKSKPTPHTMLPDKFKTWRPYPYRLNVIMERNANGWPEVFWTIRIFGSLQELEQYVHALIQTQIEL